MTDGKQLKILYGITKSNFGGAQRYVFDLAVVAKKAGHEVRVLCGGSGVLIEKLEEAGVETISLPTMGRDISLLDDIRSFFSILEILHRFEPDVFHINSSKMGGIGGLAGRIMRVPKVVFTAHGWAFNEPRPRLQKIIIKFFHWLTILLAHNIISVSEATKRDFDNWPFIKNKFFVIHNGIEKFPLESRQAARQRLIPVINEKTLLVGTLAELHRVKGLDNLLLAWSEFIQNRDAHLVIIGDGEEREELESLKSLFEIEDSVTFKGYVPDARSLLSGLDIFVLPSRSEAFPYTILEAGIAGLPVIATQVGGVPEIIENGTNGILVPKEDPKAIFSSLILLHQDKSLSKRLGESLRARVEQEFAKESKVATILKFYSSYH